MNKIIGVIQPFDITQTFYVFKDGQKIEELHPRMNEIPITICELVQVYQTNIVDIKGPKIFTKGITKKIQKEELSKYNKNEIKFNYI